MPTFGWPVLLLLSWMGQTGGEVLRQFLGGSKVDLVAQTHLLRDPAPLGEVAGIYDMRPFVS